MKRRKIHARLKAALKETAMIRLRRTFDTWNTYGYVVGRSKSWALLHVVDDCRFDGWMALRIADITRVEFSHTNFVDPLLKRRGQLPQPQPMLDLADAAALLRTAHTVAPLVQIELEKLYPGTCYIGQAERVGRRRVRLAEIGPNARWARQEADPLKKITKICLGNDYCEGLWEMGRETAPIRYD